MPKAKPTTPPTPNPAPLKEWKLGDQASTSLIHISCGGDKKLIAGPIKEIQPCPRTGVPMHKVAGFWFEAWELLLPTPQLKECQTSQTTSIPPGSASPSSLTP